MTHHKLRCPSRVHAQIIAPVVIGSVRVFKAEIVMLFGLARRTARKSRKYHYFTKLSEKSTNRRFVATARAGTLPSSSL